MGDFEYTEPHTTTDISTVIALYKLTNYLYI